MAPKNKQNTLCSNCEYNLLRIYRKYKTNIERIYAYSPCIKRKNILYLYHSEIERIEYQNKRSCLQMFSDYIDWTQEEIIDVIETTKNVKELEQ